MESSSPDSHQDESCASRDVAGAVASLTSTERRVLSALRHCQGIRAVADSLHVELSTVRTHLQRACAKLGVHHSWEAACIYCRHCRQAASDGSGHSADADEAPPDR